MKACEILKNNGIVIHPTDTVFGISGRFDSEIAYQKIFELKKRCSSKPLSVLIADFQMITQFSNILLPTIEKITPPLMKGMTILLPIKEDLPAHLLKQSSFIGLRIPQHKQTLELIKECGPLICTSANLSNETVVSSESEARKTFPDEFYLEGDTPTCKCHSTIVMFDGTIYTLIREGNVTVNELKSHIDVSLKDGMM
jgi:L-threonylcarbamoyladenylate synthase